MILVCTRDPGGARAILPALPLLVDHHEICIVGLIHSQDIYLREGWPVSTTQQPVAPDLAPDSLTHLLQKSKASAILTASTDWRQPDSIEPRLVAAARRLDIPSVGVLDHICNLAERFGLAYASSETSYLPDLLCVPHPIAIDRLVALGVDRSRLAVTGYAWLDALRSSLRAYEQTEIDRARRSLGVTGSDLVCLFAGELMTVSYPDKEHDEYYGFNEDTILDVLVPRLASIAERLGRRIFLVLKPHPKDQDRGPYHRRTGTDRGLNVVMAPESLDRNLLLQSCDIIFGMTSMILLDAVSLGLPTVSLQIGLRREDVVVTNECGASLPIYDLETLDRELEWMLSSSERREELGHQTKRFFNDGRAAQRLADTVLTFLSERAVAGKR